MKIRVLGQDPSTSNWGMAICSVDIDTLEFNVEELILQHTESQKLKGIRKDSDDLRRAGEVRGAMVAAAKTCAIAITEIPFMNPNGYAAANYNSGLVVGVLSSCPIPIIQVTPQQVKEFATGHRNATKDEMIAWAMKKFPDANWKMRKLRGQMVPTDANEHLADAVAAVNVGIHTEQFRAAIAMYRGMAAS